MQAKEVFSLAKDSFREWSQDKASRLAAAISYYTVFAFAPLLIIAIAVAGQVFGEQAAQEQIISQVRNIVGEGAAEFLQTTIEGARTSGGGTIATIISIITLLLGASGLFAAFQGALDTIWDVELTGKRGILGTVLDRAVAIVMVLAVGVVLIALMLVSTVISTVSGLVEGLLPLPGPWVVQGINLVVTIALVTVVFAVLYRVVPHARVAWRDAWIGGLVTAVLFALGQLLLGLYFTYASVGSAYGAAGSLVILLVWIYYSAQIAMFGAEFTQVYAQRHGRGLEPAQGAVRVIPAQPEEPAREERGGEEGRERAPEPGAQPAGQQARPAGYRGRGVVYGQERRRAPGGAVGRALAVGASLALVVFGAFRGGDGGR